MVWASGYSWRKRFCTKRGRVFRTREALERVVKNRDSGGTWVAVSVKRV